MIASAAVVGRVAAVANVCACAGKESFCMVDPQGWVDDSLGLGVVALRQTFDLLDVEHGIALHEEDFRSSSCRSPSSVLVMVFVHDQIAALAFSDMRAVLLRLFEGHPVWGNIPAFHGRAPKHQNVDAAVGLGVMPQGLDDPPAPCAPLLKASAK